MHKCSICDKEFDSHRKLNGHKSIHKEGGRYAVSRRKLGTCECIQCKKIFNQRTTKEQKFCSNQCQADWQYHNVTIPKVQNGEMVSKRFLVERDGEKCSCCNLETWNDQPIPLDIDHIDGNPRNNQPDNLRFLCPNCHRQTPTWGNSTTKRTMKNGRRLGSLAQR